jgi:hypothetical protein
MTTCLGTGVQSLTYITTDHGELAQSVAEDISNECLYGEGGATERGGSLHSGQI